MKKIGNIVYLYVDRLCMIFEKLFIFFLINFWVCYLSCFLIFFICCWSCLFFVSSFEIFLCVWIMVVWLWFLNFLLILGREELVIFFDKYMVICCGKVIDFVCFFVLKFLSLILNCWFIIFWIFFIVMIFGFEEGIIFFNVLVVRLVLIFLLIKDE